MNQTTAHILSRATNDFYRRADASFARTRQAPWKGWERVLDVAAFAPGDSVRVLDVAAGNLRFERYLSIRLERVEAVAIDNCPSLIDGVEPPPATHFIELDLAHALLNGWDLRLSGEEPFDLAVSFAFAHHLPLKEQRTNLLRALVESTKSGGIVAVSFWQLEHDETLLAKARATTELGCRDLGIANLDPHDYLLGWQDLEGVYRYCHSFTEDEIEELVDDLGSCVTELDRFSADGKTGDLNRYIALRKN